MAFQQYKIVAEDLHLGKCKTQLFAQSKGEAEMKGQLYFAALNGSWESDITIISAEPILPRRKHV